MKVLFAIASYDRLDRQHFLTYLKGLGFGKDEIYISTQCGGDYAAYSERYGNDATILFREGKNVCDNKNTLVERLCGRGVPVIFASDKVKSLQYLGADGKTHDVTDRAAFDRLVEWCYATAARNRATVWGVYPTSNAYFMKRSASVDKMLLGCLMGFMPKAKIRFDPLFPLKEDFELSLRVIRDGGHTMRFNNLCLNATFHTKGGCFSFWNSEGDRVNEECCRRIMAKYPTLAAKHPTRKNELRYTGKSRTIAL